MIELKCSELDYKIYKHSFYIDFKIEFDDYYTIKNIDSIQTIDDAIMYSKFLQACFYIQSYLSYGTIKILKYGLSEIYDNLYTQKTVLKNELFRIEKNDLVSSEQIANKIISINYLISILDDLCITYKILINKETISNVNDVFYLFYPTAKELKSLIVTPVDNNKLLEKFFLFNPSLYSNDSDSEIIFLNADDIAFSDFMNDAEDLDTDDSELPF